MPDDHMIGPIETPPTRAGHFRAELFLVAKLIEWFTGSMPFSDTNV